MKSVTVRYCLVCVPVVVEAALCELDRNAICGAAGRAVPAFVPVAGRDHLRVFMG